MTGLVALLAVAGCGPQEDATKPPASSSLPSGIQATVVEVRLESVPVRLELTGQVTAATQATLSSQIRAAVEELRVREGTAVAKGQVLVKLEDRDLRANFSRAEAEAENARVHLSRMQQLYTNESVSKQELDNASRAFKVAEAGRQAAAAQLGHTVITAPFDGVITEKKIEVGELASPGQPLVKLEDPRHLRLETTIAEGDLKAISRGMRVPVTIDALNGKGASLEGTVSQLLPTGDPNTHTFLVKVDLPAMPGLRTGMFGRIELDKGAAQTMLVPRSAVFERGQLTGVYVVGPDRIARLRWVKVGRELDRRLEVLSGLNAGERVLAEAAKGADGIPIRTSRRPAQSRTA
ncbi:MAG: efflux RND transporter periplasmic adaptor subunit [Nitrospirota bacterium]|nr:efflux RND transporter periplasmic adaptor subunit [Nitrospirota bacterium]